MKSLIASVLITLVLLACNKNSEATAPEEEVNAVQAIRMSAPAKLMRSDNATANLVADGSEIEFEQKIIREASLRFETPDMDATHNQITSAVKKHRAQIQSDSEGKDDESVFRNITVRIPSDNFDAFLAEVGKGVSYFDRKEISAHDVTEEFIDVDARLKAKKTLEARYLELLKKASKVSEILEIEKELAAVREEIESREGRLKYLQNHVSLSTVTIEFYKKTAIEAGVTVSYGAKMWNAIKSGFNGISAFFIGLLHMWPFIIILVALFYFLWKRLRLKKPF